MATLDVFNADPFRTIELTAAVERNPYLPDGIGALGLFTAKPIRTKALEVEELSGTLSLIPTSPRGAPPTTRAADKRKMRNFSVPRLAHEDTIMADEIAGVREFGTESTLQQMQTEAALRLVKLQRNMELTWERHRLSAIQGILLDADGSTIYNWYTEFGVAQPGWVFFNLAANVVGSLRPKCAEVTRGMLRAAKGAITARSRIVALCGDTFWDQFVVHPDVEKTYLNWQAAESLRQGTAFGGMTFADIEWINYRGTDDGSTVAIGADEVRFVVRNAPDLFQVAYAPAEFMPWVNTLGKPLYVIPIMDKDRGAWWKQELYSYPLHICTRPEVLFRGKSTAS